MFLLCIVYDQNIPQKLSVCACAVCVCGLRRHSHNRRIHNSQRYKLHDFGGTWHIDSEYKRQIEIQHKDCSKKHNVKQLVVELFVYQIRNKTKYYRLLYAWQTNTYILIHVQPAQLPAQKSITQYIFTIWYFNVWLKMFVCVYFI